MKRPVFIWRNCSPRSENFLNLKTEKIHFSETSVTIYQSTQRIITTTLNRHQHSCENIKSRTKFSNQLTV